MKTNQSLRDITPADVRKMTNGELNVLCDELRAFIYEKVSECGGHLSSNLGAVESTVALCNVFDFTKDKIIFDVGHQCYAYKALTGRADQFDTLRKEGGLSGFPKRSESKFDCYDTGHAGTSVAAAIGIAKARDVKKEDFNVIAFIGDGSFNNGLIYEALNSLRILNTRILIILNDNGMSISPTVGGMHEILSSVRADAHVGIRRGHFTVEKTDAQLSPAEHNRNKGIELLESFNLTYLGVVDGNEVDEMTAALKYAKELLKEKSVLLHIVTKKGKGYEFCEEHPAVTHGVPPVGTKKEKEYSLILGDELKKLAAKNGKIVAITAAMTDALGLRGFFESFPERAFDVGICEENAAVLCAALATQGLKPYYAIYSTFLQRAFDEIIHDVCAQDLPVTFCIDRAGISGADGETHQGVFDLSYLSLIPNLTIVAPRDTEEFRSFIKWSEKFPHPLAIRYPRSGKVVFSRRLARKNGDFPRSSKITLGSWEYLYRYSKAKITVIAVGERCLIVALKIVRALEEKNLSSLVNVVNGRFVKPLDTALLARLRGNVITIEDNVVSGGFGSNVERELLLQEQNADIPHRKFRSFGYKDSFIPQGSVASLQKEYGVSCEDIQSYIEQVLRQT